MVDARPRPVSCRFLSALLCVLLSGGMMSVNAQERAEKREAAAEEQSNDPVYAGGNAPVPSGKRAALDATDEKVMRVLWQEGVWELPYDRITNLYVSLSRPSAMVELGGSLLTAPFMLGAMKNRKLYLSVTYDEANEKPAKCIFLIRQGYGEMVELLSEHSDQNLVFESFDAKRRLTRK